MISDSIINYKNQTIVAVKRFNQDEINKLLNIGYLNFGFNKDSDLLKSSLLTNNEVIKHFIGYLQTNKVKKIINEIDYLHSLSSEKLAKEIEKYRNIPLNCFIQVNLTNQVSKNGINITVLADFISLIKKYDKINIVGLMTMGHQDDLNITRHAFKTLNELKEMYNLSYTSMGMSDDYKIALENNANFIRIGTKLKEVL